MSDQQFQPHYGDDPKARAKAEKAYRKAQRPFYKKKRVIIPAAFLALIGFSAAASGGSDDTVASDGDNTAAQSEQQSEASAPTAAAPAPTAAAPAPAAPAETRPNDGGLVVESFQATSEFGVCQIDLRITNTNSGTESGAITVTAFAGGEVLDTTNGFFNDVAAGDTFTVQSLGTKDCAGADTIDFERSF